MEAPGTGTVVVKTERAEGEGTGFFIHQAKVFEVLLGQSDLRFHTQWEGLNEGCSCYYL